MTYIPGTEVATFPEGSQFEGGESAYLCVFFGVADIAGCAQPGHSPLMSWETVDQTADRLANEVQGSGSSVHSQGASLQDEYSALQKISLKYAPLSVSSVEGDSNTLAHIKEQINAGIPVLLCAAEDSFIDTAIGRPPYHWTPSGNHCIVVSGYTSDGNLLVRDYASVGNAWPAGSKRTYIASRIQAVSATAIYPYWKAVSMPVPQGWKDNGSTLTAPNGHYLVSGFRKWVMDHNWDASDQPNEEEYGVPEVLLHNTQVGGGTRVTTRDHLLWWTAKDGVHQEPYMGLELSSCYGTIAKLEAEVKSLQNTTPLPTDIKNFMTAVSQAVQQLQTSLFTQTGTSGGQPVVPALSQFLTSLQSALKPLEADDLKLTL